ncbi:MAG: bifunctional glutamate N-acetyltransferase/amino-acid acetyltransferase ArgJ [Phyllobacteriaceae bacterium]|nr:bifunctional glutamate N-acetyltransferase/amino-acid acetyltransferase ArgJ [Phyllobacteriaceae bacterium]
MGNSPLKVSPLAPADYPAMPAIEGARLAAVEAGIKYKNREDLAVIVFDNPASVAGVFTRSKCPSAPVDWCRKHLPKGKARAVVVNSGNANAFTGKKGADAVRQTAQAAREAFGCKPSEVFVASTGVIGEPLDASGFAGHLQRADAKASTDGWAAMARAIMTTDTYPKMATRSFEADGVTYRLNGMAKGSGMIQPDMATMLSFLVTDYPVASGLLQKLLAKAVDPSFNSISVDSDTSTSDTVLLFSALNGRKGEHKAKSAGAKAFARALGEVLHELAMLVVRDGEGASKHVEITVGGAKSAASARRIAGNANLPLVKTAIAGEDANWGRIVMAVGKAGEPADRDRLEISFGGLTLARKGLRAPDYDEEKASQVMKRDFIDISVDVGVGHGKATVWTCDLTADYVAINADYRS